MIKSIGGDEFQFTLFPSTVLRKHKNLKVKKIMNAKFSSVKKFSYIQIILFSLGFSVVLFILSSHFTQFHQAKVCSFKMFLLHLIIENFS